LTLYKLTWKRRDTPFGAVDLCAAGFGAPHIRQRLYWVGHSESITWGLSAGRSREGSPELVGSGQVSIVADHPSNRRQQRQSDAGGSFVGNGEGQAIRLKRNGAADGMAGSSGKGLQGRLLGREEYETGKSARIRWM
jgi:site-specific DNA-cytosine methylase